MVDALAGRACIRAIRLHGADYTAAVPRDTSPTQSDSVSRDDDGHRASCTVTPARGCVLWRSVEGRDRLGGVLYGRPGPSEEQCGDDGADGERGG
jgi:hypothetical protein